MATTNLSVYEPVQLHNADALRIGIIVSRWNSFSTYGMRDGAREVLESHGLSAKQVEIIEVPGAFELSYACARACESKKYDAIIAIGCVIRGETAHFDYVCSGVTQGITLCNIQYPTPVIFCVLTDDTKEQSIARSGGALGNKGVEAAVTALEMTQLQL